MGKFSAVHEVVHTKNPPHSGISRIDAILILAFARVFEYFGGVRKRESFLHLRIYSLHSAITVVRHSGRYLHATHVARFRDSWISLNVKPLKWDVFWILRIVIPSLARPDIEQTRHPYGFRWDVEFVRTKIFVTLTKPFRNGLHLHYAHAAVPLFSRQRFA